MIITCTIINKVCIFSSSVACNSKRDCATFGDLSRLARILYLIFSSSLDQIYAVSVLLEDAIQLSTAVAQRFIGANHLLHS